MPQAGVLRHAASRIRLQPGSIYALYRSAAINRMVAVYIFRYMFQGKMRVEAGVWPASLGREAVLFDAWARERHGQPLTSSLQYTPRRNGSVAMAISHPGQAVGYSSGPTGVRAVIWTPAGQRLGPRPRNQRSRGCRRSYDTASGPRAVLWEGGAVQDLGTLPRHGASGAEHQCQRRDRRVLSERRQVITNSARSRRRRDLAACLRRSGPRRGK